MAIVKVKTESCIDENTILQAAATLKDMAAELVADAYTRPLSSIDITLFLNQDCVPELSVTKNYIMGCNLEDDKTFLR